MNIRRTFRFLPLAALAFTAPAAEAQELSAPQPAVQSPAAPAVSEASARSAAALLPAETDAAVYMARAGELLASLGDDAEMKKQMSAIGSAAVSAGAGSADMLDNLMRLVGALDLVDVLGNMEEDDMEHVRVAAADIIRGEVAELRARLEAEVMQALDSLSMAPLYVALSPAPGKEAELQSFSEQLKEHLQDLAENEPKWKRTEWQGFVGVSSSVSDLMGEELPFRMARNEAFQQKLAQKKISLLTKMHNGALLFVLCGEAEAISLPAEEGQSLLHAPALSGMGADELVRAWLSPRVQQLAYSFNRQSINMLFELAAGTFEKLAASDAANQEPYRKAAQAATHIREKLFPELPAVQVPLTLQVRQQGSEVTAELRCDAMGMRFLPAKSRFAAFAEARQALFFAEISGVSQAVAPRFDGLVDDVLVLFRGGTLALDERTQDQVSQQLLMLEAFRPEINRFIEGIQTVWSGFEGPGALGVYALDGDASTPCVAISSGIGKRELLGEGWVTMLCAVQQAAVKMGMGQFVAMLPIVSLPLGDTAMSYMLFLPMLSELQPQIVLDDRNFVAGSSPAINTQILQTAEADGAPFCGMVATFRPSLLADALQKKDAESAASRDADFLRSVESIRYTSTEEQGVLTGRLLIKLLQAAPAEP